MSYRTVLEAFFDQLVAAGLGNAPTGNKSLSLDAEFLR
jgi:hypothetical protein